MAGPELKKPQQSEFIKDQQDRVAADAGMVGQILEPNRTSETVRFPDPSVPGPASGTYSSTPQSMAELELARRTDAGRRQPRSAATGTNKGNIWLGGAAALIVLILALVWIWGASNQ
jgi:hypothetical protein